jgi:hypothetical protein
MDLSCSIVYAGLEPIDFINLFPKWTIHMKARQQNQLVRVFFLFGFLGCLFFSGRQKLKSKRFSSGYTEKFMS